MKHNRMYNAEMKERFIEQGNFSQTMEGLFRNVFDLVAPYEEEKCSDICTWDIQECKRVLEVLAGFRSYSSENRANLIRRYVKWCIEQGVPGASDAIFHVKASGDTKIREMTLSGPAHLESILNAVFSPVSDVTSDNILRAYCWLAFCGMDDNGIVALRTKEVDLSSLVITSNGEKYQIVDEAVPCFRILKEMSAFRYYHPGYDDGFIWRPRVDGDKFLRGIRTAEQSVVQLRSMLSKTINAAVKDKKIDVKISHYRIWISGEFYRAFQKELRGESIDFYHLAERAVRIREEKGEPYKLEADSRKRTIDAKKREIETGFQNDYIRWKRAYYA